MTCGDKTNGGIEGDKDGVGGSRGGKDMMLMEVEEQQKWSCRQTGNDSQRWRRK